MFIVKLIKGCSYIGNGIRATKQSPLCELKTEKLADIAINSGYFELISKTGDKKIDKKLKTKEVNSEELFSDFNE